MHGFGALMITLSCLSPSIGVFIVGSDVIRQAGTGVFVCFVAAALLGVLMACIYAELVSAFPDTGGEYTLLGRTLGPTAGFAVLGLLLNGFAVGEALSSLGIASYLRVIAPGLQATPTALVISVLVTLVAVLNIRINALVTGVFLSLEVLSLVVLTVLGFSHPQRGLSAVIHPVALADGLKLAPTALAVMGTAAAGAIYAFNGYGSVVSIAEELHEAPRRVAGVIFWALGLAALLELGPMLAMLLGAPDLAALIRAPSPAPFFIGETGGHVLAVVMSLAVALAIFNANIAVALMAGRQLYSTGRDGVWSAAVNRALSHIHPRFKSPWIATLTMGGVTLLWCLLPLRILVIVIAGGTVTIYAGLCLAVLAGRRNGASDHTRFRMPLFPAVPILALIALVGVAWTSLSDADGRLGFMVSAGVVAISALLYQGVLKRRGGWAHRGPLSGPMVEPLSAPVTLEP
jgi:amino acid transporter